MVRVWRIRWIAFWLVSYHNIVPLASKNFQILQIEQYYSIIIDYLFSKIVYEPNRV